MKFKSLLLIPLLVASLQAASVDDLTFTLNSDGTEYTVSDCDTTASGSLEIPSTYNGLPVTSIMRDAFSHCRSLTSIAIPDDVTSIGQRAFRYCSDLTSITIPNSVTSIGLAAFFHCSSLTSITIPSSVSLIKSSVFYHCSSLTSITIPSGVTSIERTAFYGCSSLTSITIPSSVTSIGVSAFLDCTSLTSITISNGVNSIGDRAFKNCSSLISITIPDSVTSIGDDAFALCSGLTNVTIGDSVTSIGDDAFASCSSLTSITIPDSVISIGSGAFSGCTSLNSITIPDSVTSIGAFSNTGLSFSEDTNSIKYLISASGNTAYLIDGSSSSGDVIVPNTVLGASVNLIGDNAFNDCTGLTSITIPDSVTSIGIQAFYRCSGLTSITIGNGVTTIGGGAFSECSSLTSITIPNSVTSIGGGAFFDCWSLTSITISDSVTSIGNYAFAFCPSLESITFKGDAPTLGTDVFEITDSVKVYYYNDATGFTSPTWQGVQAEMISRFAPVIVGIEKLEDGVNLWFNSAIGESYRIESSYDLENWTILEDQIPASSELIERLYSTDDYSRRFFRVNLNTVEFTFIGTNNHDFSAYYGDEAIISAANIPLYPTGTDKYYLASYQVIEWSGNTPIGGLQYGRPKVTVATTSSLIGHNLYIRFFKYDPNNANNFSTSGPPLSIDGDALAQQDQTVEAVSAIGVASQLGYSVRVWKEAKP